MQRMFNTESNKVRGRMCYINTLPSNDELVAQKLQEEEFTTRKKRDEEDRTNESLPKIFQQQQDMTNQKANPKREQQ